MLPRGRPAENAEVAENISEKDHTRIEALFLLFVFLCALCVLCASAVQSVSPSLRVETRVDIEASSMRWRTTS
jgi:hypothetical protein